MNKFILVALAGMISTSAMAAPMYDSKSMTCSSVHEMMAKNGMVVLRIPSHQAGSMAYNRYVSNSMSCLGQGAMSSATVPTSDDPACKMKTCSFTTGKGPNKNH